MYVSLCVSLAPCIEESSLPLVLSERVNTDAQANSFWHLQTGIPSCPCDRSGLGFSHGGSHEEACFYYFCRRRARGLPVPDLSVQWVRVVHSILTFSGLVHLSVKPLNVRGKACSIRSYISISVRRIRDQLHELFSSPRWRPPGQYISCISSSLCL